MGKNKGGKKKKGNAEKKKIKETRIVVTYSDKEAEYIELPQSKVVTRETISTDDGARNTITKVFIPDGCTRLDDEALKGTMIVNFNIPQSVTTIGFGVFDGCHKLTSIVDVPFTDKIEDFSFRGCHSLTKMTRKHNVEVVVKEIGKHAFDGCIQLSLYVITDNIHTIGKFAFAGSGIKTLNLSVPVSIGDEAFARSRLSKVIMVETKKMGTGVFLECCELGSVVMHDEQTIPDHTFRGCTSLLTANIIAAETIGNMAFTSCNRLKSVLWCEELQKIGNNAFEDCSRFRPTSGFSYTVTEIGCRAFANCTELESDCKEFGTDRLTFPVLRFVDRQTFLNCEKLRHLVFPVATSFGERAFTMCSNLISIEGKCLKEIGVACFSGCTSLRMAPLTELMVEIPAYAFSFCRSITTIKIPWSIIYISTRAFFNCISLRTVELKPIRNSLAMCTVESALDMETTNIIDWNFQPCLTVIGPSAFEKCYDLTDLVLPMSVILIGDFAFAHCQKLPEVILPTNCTICKGAFLNCIRLGQAKASPVCKIDMSAFWGCSNPQFLLNYGRVYPDPNILDVFKFATRFAHMQGTKVRAHIMIPLGYDRSAALTVQIGRENACANLTKQVFKTGDYLTAPSFENRSGLIPGSSGVQGSNAGIIGVNAGLQSIPETNDAIINRIHSERTRIVHKDVTVQYGTQAYAVQHTYPDVQEDSVQQKTWYTVADINALSLPHGKAYQAVCMEVLIFMETYMWLEPPFLPNTSDYTIHDKASTEVPPIGVTNFEVPNNPVVTIDGRGMGPVNVRINNLFVFPLYPWTSKGLGYNTIRDALIAQYPELPEGLDYEILPDYSVTALTDLVLQRSFCLINDYLSLRIPFHSLVPNWNLLFPHPQFVCASELAIPAKTGLSTVDAERAFDFHKAHMQLKADSAKLSTDLAEAKSNVGRRSGIIDQSRTKPADYFKVGPRDTDGVSYAPEDGPINVVVTFLDQDMRPASHKMLIPDDPINTDYPAATVTGKTGKPIKLESHKRLFVVRKSEEFKGLFDMCRSMVRNKMMISDAIANTRDDAVSNAADHTLLAE